MSVEIYNDNIYNYTKITICNKTKICSKELVCIIGKIPHTKNVAILSSHYTKSNTISCYWTDFDKDMYFEYVSYIHKFTCTFYGPKGILIYDSTNIKHIFTKEERIQIFAKELLFYKHRKELTKAVRVYKEKRRKILEQFLLFDLCKIVEEYVS